MKQNKAKSGLRISFVLISLIVTAYIVSFVGLLQPTAVQAQGFSVQLVPAGCTDENGCNICEIVYIFTNAADLVGVFLSSLALLMFIIGGLLWIFSAGQSERVDRGKKIILGTVTGLAIVFLAWFAVNVIVRVASSSGNNTQSGVGTSTEIFSRDWWDLSYCTPATPSTCKNYTIGTICGFGEAGCAGSNSCTCYRPTDPTGDDNLCTGADATSPESANVKDKSCYCASQCTRLKLKTSQDYTCAVTKATYDANTSRYEKASVSCPTDTYVCTKPAK